MSRLNFSDYMETDTDNCGMVDPLTQLRRELDEIDVHENLNYENPGLMSSEFFDSVLSIEQCNFDNDLDSRVFGNADTDCGLSSDGDELRITNNCSPDSAASHTSYELNDFLLHNNNKIDYKTKDESVLNFLQQPKIDLVKLEPKNPTKVFINNAKGKKVIVTKPCNIKNNRKPITNAKQVFKVQSISGKGRSLLLPFNVAKMKNIKIINGKNLQAENIKITKASDPLPKPVYDDHYEVSSPDIFDDDSDSVEAKSVHECEYPVLILSDEEKRLLAKEGIHLPTHYPLTKNQERELKRIRRKIRNKISAQDSRKRKKEYVDGLEQQIKQGAEEKKILMNRVKHLQQQNNKLIAQMNKLQALVFNSSNSKATPTTCLLIVLASILLVSLPNLRLQKNAELNGNQQITAGRALLSSQQATNEDTLNLEEFPSYNKEDESEIKKMFDEENNTEEYINTKYINSKFDVGKEILNKHGSTFLETTEFENDLRNTFNKVKSWFEQEFKGLPYGLDTGTLPLIGRKFIEPDIDDVEPNIEDEYLSSKRLKLSDTNQNVGYSHKPKATSNVVSATVSVNSSRKE